MTPDQTFVIVGGGLAGGNAAVTLREEGFKGRSCSSAASRGSPSGAPAVEDVLRSEEDLDGWYVRPADWYDEHDVELLQSSVVAVDVDAQAWSSTRAKSSSIRSS